MTLLLQEAVLCCSFATVSSSPPFSRAGQALLLLHQEGPIFSNSTMMRSLRSFTFSCVGVGGLLEVSPTQEAYHP